MQRFFAQICVFVLSANLIIAQSSTKTFMNPVIPGDHPDCTLTKVGNDFYTTGSSFNPTPVIYHSTDLVHWEAIAQPVSAAWSGYGDTPSGGCWGGQVVFYNNKFWDFFSRNNQMYYVTANDIRGDWTMPTVMNCPTSVPGLGYDNSIFIDDDGSWYLLVKNGQVNNWIVQLDNNGQPNGKIFNLCWINPSPSYPFSWAEGPVMWKYKGYYFYSFAKNVAGGQIVFRSPKLTDEQSSWTNLGNFFNEGDPLKYQALFQNPNHSSAAVMINDSTSWVIHPLWRNANNNEWYGQGRQGLLNQVTYDANGKPTADYPANISKNAPLLPSSGIPWMVPHSDFFNSDKLNPEWSFLGYTPASSYSLSTRKGWLALSSKRLPNTIIKNDGEHNYSLITRLDFTAQSVGDQAGIQIFNGLQTLYAKLFSSVDSIGQKIIVFSYKTNYYKVNNPAKNGDNIVLLKLLRVNHILTAYYGFDGFKWTQIGNSINVFDMDNLQSNNNAWTGNRQGLYVFGNSTAYFDYYIYRDAYTPIMAECPANQYGTSPVLNRTAQNYLGSIHNGDWALYAGVEFGNNEYVKKPDSLSIVASCASSGGIVEFWIDSLDSKVKIAECYISNTGDWNTFKTFTVKVLTQISGKHDLYLKFNGASSDELCVIQSFFFIDKTVYTSIKNSQDEQLPDKYILEQNYPNPFNPETIISWYLPMAGNVYLKLYDLLGREIKILADEFQIAGFHSYRLSSNEHRLTSGIYFYTLKTGNFLQTKKMILIK